MLSIYVVHDWIETMYFKQDLIRLLKIIGIVNISLSSVYWKKDYYFTYIIIYLSNS